MDANHEDTATLKLKRKMDSLQNRGLKKITF